MISIEQIPLPLRRVSRWVGYPIFAIVVALMSLYFSLPRDVIRDRIETALSADSRAPQPGLGMDVRINEVDLTILLGPGVFLDHVEMRTRPTVPTEKPTRFVIDDLTLRTGILGQLFHSPSYSFKSHLLSGELSGDVSMSKSSSEVELNADQLVLTNAPGLSALTTLPLEGKLSMKTELAMDKQLASTTHGQIDITIDDAAVGDGKAKLKIAGDPFLAAGITVPKIKLGKIDLKIPVDKGRVKLDGTKIKSSDIELYVDGFIDLRDPTGNSQMNLWVRVKPSEALAKKEPTIELMTNSMQKTSDGFIGLQVTGTFNYPRSLPAKEPQAGLSSTARAAVAVAPATPAVPTRRPTPAPAPPQNNFNPPPPPNNFNPPPTRPAFNPPPPPPGNNGLSPQPGNNGSPSPSAGPPPSPPPKAADVEVNTPSEAPPAPPVPPPPPPAEGNQ